MTSPSAVWLRSATSVMARNNSRRRLHVAEDDRGGGVDDPAGGGGSGPVPEGRLGTLARRHRLERPGLQRDELRGGREHRVLPVEGARAVPAAVGRVLGPRRRRRR